MMGAVPLQLVTGVPADECLERLADAIGDPGVMTFSTLPRRPEKAVVGYIRDQSFCLCRAYPANSFSRRLQGHVHPYKAGTLIEGRFRLHPLTKVAILMGLVMSLLLVPPLSVLVLLSILAGLQDQTTLGAAFTVMVLLTSLAVIRSCYRRSENDIQFLEDFLVHLLDAQRLAQEVDLAVQGENDGR